MLTSGMAWQVADRGCHALPALIEFAGVHQRSGRFSSVQIRNRILGRGSSPAQNAKPIHWPRQTYPGSDGACGCPISRHPPHPGTADCHPVDYGAPTQMPGSGGTNRTMQQAGRLAPAVTFGGLSAIRRRTTGRRAHRSIRALAVPAPSPDSADLWMARGIRSGSGTAVHKRGLRSVPAHGAGPGS